MSEQPSSAHWQLQSIVTGLRGAREQWRTRNGRSIGEQGGRELPSREAMRQILEQLCGALFPMRLGPVDLREESEDFYVGHTLDAALTALEKGEVGLNSEIRDFFSILLGNTKEGYFADPLYGGNRDKGGIAFCHVVELDRGGKAFAR